MTTTWVIIAYGAAAVLALFWLYRSGTKAWYWHLASAVIALAIGLVPIPEQFNTPVVSLIIGTVFVFLFSWALAAPFFARRRRTA